MIRILRNKRLRSIKNRMAPEVLIDERAVYRLLCHTCSMIKVSLEWCCLGFSLESRILGSGGWSNSSWWCHPYEVYFAASLLFTFHPWRCPAIRFSPMLRPPKNTNVPLNIILDWRPCTDYALNRVIMVVVGRVFKLWKCDWSNWPNRGACGS